MVLKGRSDVRDTEMPALSVSEEKRKAVFWGASGQGTEGDGVGSVFRLRVLTRGARGVEGGEDSSSLIEGGLKKRIPCFGVVVV